MPFCTLSLFLYFISEYTEGIKTAQAVLFDGATSRRITAAGQLAQQLAMALPFQHCAILKGFSVKKVRGILFYIYCKKIDKQTLFFYDLFFYF